MIKYNTSIFGIKEVKSKLSKLNKVFSQAESKQVQLKFNQELYNEWYKKERVQTFKTGGKNINKLFPRSKKYNSNYKKVRKYNVSIGWSLGVWSGASYYALQKETSAGNRKYFKRITHNSIIIRLSGKGSNYLNLTIGMSDSLLKKYRDKVNKYLEKQINAIK